MRTSIYGIERKDLEVVQKCIQNGWIQGVYAKNSKNEPCSVFEGCCFCLAGAITFASKRDSDKDLKITIFVEEILREKGFIKSVENWNDVTGRTREDVLALLDTVL